MATGNSSDDDFERIHLEVGDNIFTEGDEGDRAYIVESGVVEISRELGGKKVILGNIEANGIFGEMALIDEETRIASAAALTESVLIPVPKVAVQAHLGNADPLLRKLIYVLVANARSLSDHITRVMEGEN